MRLTGRQDGQSGTACHGDGRRTLRRVQCACFYRVGSWPAGSASCNSKAQQPSLSTTGERHFLFGMRTYTWLHWALSSQCTHSCYALAMKIIKKNCIWKSSLFELSYFHIWTQGHAPLFGNASQWLILVFTTLAVENDLNSCRNACIMLRYIYINMVQPIEAHMLFWLHTRH